MEISSGLQREFWMDLTASSAVNRPIISASFRSVVVWIGVRSMRCTYSGARVPLRFTFTRNLVFFMLSPPGSGQSRQTDANHQGGSATKSKMIVSVANAIYSSRVTKWKKLQMGLTKVRTPKSKKRYFRQL